MFNDFPFKIMFIRIQLSYHFENPYNLLIARWRFCFPSNQMKCKIKLFLCGIFSLSEWKCLVEWTRNRVECNCRQCQWTRIEIDSRKKYSPTKANWTWWKIAFLFWLNEMLTYFKMSHKINEMEICFITFIPKDIQRNHFHLVQSAPTYLADKVFQ